LTNWRAVWVIFAAGLAAGAYMTKTAPALPALRAELGLTLVESGLIATVFNVMGMAVGMIAGVLCDRFGHKRPALFGLWVMAAGGLMGAASTGFASLLFSRFVEGLGFLLFAVTAPALMSAAAPAPRDRAKALGLWSAYMPTGGTIALLAAPALIGAWGWRGLWTASALAAAATAGLFWRLVPASSYGSISSLRLVVESVARKGNLVMALLFLCYVAQWTSVMLWLPTFLVDEHRVSTGAAALATALMVLVNAPGNLLGGWLLSRGIPRGRLIASGALMAAACEAGMLADALPGALRYAAVLLFSMSAGVIPAAIFAGLPVHARTPQHIATGNGIVMQASNLGQFLGPLLFAWIASRLGGWSVALWPMLAFAGLAVALGIALGRIERNLPARR
jgi:MFS transporter, DHA1 family, inner membrane transport protein